MTSTAPDLIVYRPDPPRFQAIWGGGRSTVPEAPATPRQRLAAARAKINRHKPLRFRRP